MTAGDSSDNSFKKRQYLIAIIPPHDISIQVRKIQEEFSETYNSIAALKNKPHVTLIPPFWATEDEIAQAVNSINNWVQTKDTFQIVLSGFASFKRNEVIFINVVENDMLNGFQKSLENIFVELFPEKKFRSARRYHPHFTIGYRDLSHSAFKKAEADYLEKKFETSFCLQKIFLWKHNGKGWDIVREFDLRNKKNEPDVNRILQRNN